MTFIPINAQTTPMADTRTSNLQGDRIEVESDYALCAWARHFNTSEKRVREAVQAVGDSAVRVRDHLLVVPADERPSAQ